MEATSRPKLPTWVLALIVPVLAVIVAVVTLNVTSDDAGAGAAPKNGTEVVIKNFAFSPTPLHVKVGVPVTVANQDGTAHTLTADHGAFDTGRLDGGMQTTITVKKAGTYTYHCDIHNYMTGTIEAS